MVHVNEIHKLLEEKLAQIGTSLDGIYVCPHDIGECECRKPLPGLILQAKKDFPEINLKNSIVIGDSINDLIAGVAACCGLLVFFGNKANAPEKIKFVFSNLKSVNIDDFTKANAIISYCQQRKIYDTGNQ
jgi:histidinol phosphatase-like enzyme